MYLRSVELMSDKIEQPGQYPFNIPSIQSLKRLSFKNNITFFVGENGSGKSTLLEGIAHQCGFNTAGIECCMNYLGMISLITTRRTNNRTVKQSKERLDENRIVNY